MSSAADADVSSISGLNLRTFRSITMSTINTDSNRSSYDNMPTASSFEGKAVNEDNAGKKVKIAQYRVTPVVKYNDGNRS